ncbi:MAG: hypothetical protein M3X11_21440 [Acidobacteriota bacterium]|nr:hypothetical protein [Acidobacteriota bacterium]
MKKKQTSTEQFAVCLDNSGYKASLEIGKLYQVIHDEEAVAHGYLRVVDESGEDYAFTATRFHLISLPVAVEQVLLAAAHV